MKYSLHRVYLNQNFLFLNVCYLLLNCGRHSTVVGCDNVVLRV